MSRFDVIKFNPPPDPELVCGICMQVLDMPKESPCRHVFCKVCIGQALQEKSKCPICRTGFKQSHLKDVLPLVQNMLNKLTMTCDYHDTGCKELIPMERFISHVSSCGYVMVTCKFSLCGKSLLKLNLTQHETQECEYREIDCLQGCSLPVAWKNRSKHNCLDALILLKDEYIKKNEQLEAKIKDLNSTISDLNSKLEEHKKEKRINSEASGRDRDLNTDNYFIGFDYNPHREVSVRSVSSWDSDLQDDSHIVDYYSPLYSDLNFEDEQDNSIDDFDYSVFNSDNHGNEDPEPPGEDDIENHSRAIDNWVASSVQDNVVVESSVDDVYPYDAEIDPSEPTETWSSLPDEHQGHSVQAQAPTSMFFFPSGESSDNGRSASNSRKRLQASAAVDWRESKRRRTDGHPSDHDYEGDNDTSVRRSRRLQNREPSPTTEIPYVEVPPSASFLLDAYANEDNSSDDGSWSPSQLFGNDDC